MEGIRQGYTVCEKNFLKLMGPNLTQAEGQVYGAG